MNATTTNTSVIVNCTFIASEMAKRFNGFAKKTAESVLQMAKVVSDMKAQKNKAEFEKFCDLIGYKSDSSLIRKFTQIGNKFDQLITNADKLPNTWTTVYQISLLSDDAITTLMEKGVINPCLAGKKLQEVLSLSQPKATVVAAAATEVVPNGTDDGICFKARLPSVPNAAVREQLKRILKDLNAINFEVEQSSTLQEFLVDEPMALAA